MYASITEVFMQNDLTHLAEVFSPKVFNKITDPRSKHGTYLPCAGILALVFLGLLAGQNYLTHIRQWAKHHWTCSITFVFDDFKGLKPLVNSLLLL